MSKKKKLAPKDRKSRYDEFDDDEFVRRYERLDDDDLDSDSDSDYEDNGFDEYEYNDDEFDDDDEFES